MFGKERITISRFKARQLRRMVIGSTPEARIEELALDFRATEGAADDVATLELDEEIREKFGVDNNRKSSLLILSARVIQEAFDYARHQHIDEESVRQHFFGNSVERSSD